MSDVLVFDDEDSLAVAAAEKFIDLAAQSIKQSGVFAVVLSGGSTPQKMYKYLATEKYSKQIDWSKVHLFWGDERCVPPDSQESNYFQATKSLINHIPIPDENVHRIEAEKPAKEAADLYEEKLLDFFQSHKSETHTNQPSFDLVLLGMGEDGHTASLFPNTDVVHETTRWVKSVYVERLGIWRVTLTPLILNQAKIIIFLVTGKTKNWTLQKVLYGLYQPEKYPSQAIQPVSGNLLWMIDKAAAIFIA